jgi:DNA-binding response OmpR family regulator
MRVLLVEDNPTVRKTLEWFMGRSGHEVFAVDLIALAADVANAQRLDLIVSDFYLPDGNGVDFMRWLTAQRPVPGIAISGDPDPSIRELCLMSGFSIFLPKPVLAQMLEDAIQQLFRAEEQKLW